MLKDNHLHRDDVELLGLGVTDFFQSTGFAVGITAMFFLVLQIMDDYVALQQRRKGTSLSTAFDVQWHREDVFLIVFRYFR